jgi:hypothetical protein
MTPAEARAKWAGMSDEDAAVMVLARPKMLGPWTLRGSTQERDEIEDVESGPMNRARVGPNVLALMEQDDNDAISAGWRLIGGIPADVE